jgi:hypothetical protein
VKMLRQATDSMISTGSHKAATGVRRNSMVPK